MKLEIFDSHSPELNSLKKERKERFQRLLTELKGAYLGFLEPTEHNITVASSAGLAAHYAQEKLTIKEIKHFCVGYQRKLGLPEGWDIYLNNVKDKGTGAFLNQLKSSWLGSKDYASYTGSALYYVARIITPKVENEIEEALKELKAKRKEVASRLYKKYKKHLEDSLKQIKKSKSNLIEAILLRMLALTKNGDFSQSNMVIWLMNMLRDNHILNQVIGLPKVEYPFKPDELSFFNEYVFENGNKRQKARFINMRWPSESSKLMLIQTKKSLVTSPVSVYQAAFPKFRGLNWLKRKLSSYTWFVQEMGGKQHHLAHVMAMTSWGVQVMPGRRLVNHPTQKKIVDFSIMVNQELSFVDSRLADMPQKKWNPFNYKRRILIEWRNYLLSVRDEILVKQLDILQAHGQNVRTKCMVGEIKTNDHVDIKDITLIKSHIDRSPYEKTDSRKSLEKQREIFKKNSSFSALMDECREYIMESKREMAKKQKSIDEAAFVKEVRIEVDKLKKGILPQGGDLNKLYRYYKHVIRNEEIHEKNKEFIDDVDIATKLVYKNIKRHVMMLSIENTLLQVEQHTSLIFRADNIIRQLGSYELQQRHARFIQKQWVRYLIFIAERSTKNDAVDNAMLGLLETIGDEVVRRSADSLRKKINSPLVEVTGTRIKNEALRVAKSIFITDLKKDRAIFDKSFISYLTINRNLSKEAVNTILSISDRMIEAKIVKIEKIRHQLTFDEVGLIGLNEKRSIIPSLLEIRVGILCNIKYRDQKEFFSWKKEVKDKLNNFRKNEAKFFPILKKERKFEKEVYEKMQNLSVRIS